ncbi:MAG: NAD(P)-dependent oxidoreductase [Myxococcaceae bacterium]|nr:MAG: NAD(P)-dependent oxidoreductase [Myxococcaceae bacterium]
MARVFLAGASGIIGQRLIPLLVRAGHAVTGTTRSAERVDLLRELGSTPCVVEAFDGAALERAVAEAAPEVVIHQLTNLPDRLFSLDPEALERAIRGNAQMRTEGTRHLVSAATAAGARRLVAQSILWIYAPGREPHVETDPVNTGATGLAAITVQGTVALERGVLGAAMESVVLRYGWLYGPGTGRDTSWKDPAVHVDAAAHAAFLAVSRGSGPYNAAEASPYASSDRARRELGWSPDFRL